MVQQVQTLGAIPCAFNIIPCTLTVKIQQHVQLALTVNKSTKKKKTYMTERRKSTTAALSTWCSIRHQLVFLKFHDDNNDYDMIRHQPQEKKHSTAKTPTPPTNSGSGSSSSTNKEQHHQETTTTTTTTTTTNNTCLYRRHPVDVPNVVVLDAQVREARFHRPCQAPLSGGERFVAHLQ